jgi:hypothetical protein|tara:strand:- start:1401 stop:4112 length:2712 start_codon:yes stop_codon:yes gene_type:complete
MATLVSPGVAVSVIDESFYGSAGAGTVPLIICATGQDKAHVSGSGYASGTIAANKGKVQLITSQRELIQTYGTPFFRTVSGTASNGDEVNEYGLLAAYSYLGGANRAYVLRADVNTTQLLPTTTEPKGDPANGAIWWDTANSVYGLFEWSSNSGTWVKQTVTPFTAAQMTVNEPTIASAGGAATGDFRIAVINASSKALGTDVADAGIWEWDGAAWQVVSLGNNAALNGGSGRGAVTVGPSSAQPSGPADKDLWFKTSSDGQGTSLVIKSYSSNTSSFDTKAVKFYVDDATAAQPGNFDSGRPADIIVTSLNSGALKSDPASGADSSFVILDGGSGYTSAPALTISGAGTATAVITNGVVTDVVQTAAGSGYTDMPTVTLTGGVIPPAGSIYAVEDSTSDVVEIALKRFAGTLATSAAVADATSTFAAANEMEAGATAIVGETADGTLWYDSSSSIDLYINTSNIWIPKAVGAYSTVAPTSPSNGDVWVDTNDLDNYPLIKVYNNTTSSWDARDNTDQSTANGVVFADLTATAADITYNSGATRLANAPNGALYPEGTMCVNMAHSKYQVRKYVSSELTTHKWRTAAGNKANGAGYFGRKSQRAVVVKAMQAALTSNSDIRGDSTNITLIASPGYPECADEMLTLNVDRKETAFVIIDTPFRLTPSGVTAWQAGTSTTENGEDGLITSGSQCAVYYPSGLATNTDGTSVVVPASHMVLRTMNYNDSVAYPWFAPAGLTRGLISNATNVGYLDSEGEFSAVALNQGQRDTLYTAKVNPITNFPGQGLFVYGQKTLYAASSALDRINVARLVAYLRDRLDPLARPFAFEPNDESTRASAAEAVSRFLGDIMSKRGVYDFAVVCDETNNTAGRIDKNELWIDIAIEPAKAAEFIYIPIRIVNTGTL